MVGEGKGSLVWGLHALPFLIFVPFFLWDIIPWLLPYDEKRFAASIIVILIGLSVSLSPALSKEVTDIFMATPFLARLSLATIFLLAIITSLLSPEPWLALREMTLYGLLVMMALYVAYIYKAGGINFVRVYVVAIILLAFIYLCRSFVDYTFDLLLGHINEEKRRAINFVNVRFFNQLQAWTYPFLIFATITNKIPNSLRAVAFITAVGWVALALFGKGAGVIVAILLSVILCFLFCNREAKINARPFFLYSALSVILGILVHGVVFILLPKALVLDVNAQNMIVSNIALAGREKLWMTSWSWIHESPILGNGPLNLVTFINNPHNALLQWASEWGGLSLFVVMTILGWGMLSWIMHSCQGKSHLKKEDLYWRITLTVAIVSGMALSQVSGVLVTPFSQLSGAIVVGLMIGSFQKNYKPQPPVSKPKCALVRSFSIFLVALYVEITLPEVFDRYQTQDGLMRTYLARYERGETLSPRFWQHGPFPHEETNLPQCVDYHSGEFDWLCYAKLEVLREAGKR